MDLIEPLDGDVSVGGQMMRTIWVLYGIATVVVGVRLYTQLKVTRQLGLGDALMSLSVFCGLILCAMLTAQHHYGLGRHWFYLSNHEKSMVLEFNFIGQAFAVMAPCFGRMATIMMMLQLFGTVHWRRVLLWTVFWGSLFVNSLTLILIYVQCQKVQTLWDPINQPSKCWDKRIQTYTGYVQGSVNSAIDMFLTVLPAQIFWDLQIARSLKAGLAILLGLSIFAFIACIIKTVHLPSKENTEVDYSFRSVPFFTWVVVECVLVNIAASVPLIRPLFLKYMKKGSFSNPTGKSYEMNHQYGTSASRGIRLESRGHERDISNASEENILPLEGIRIDKDSKDTGIVMATRFDVTYEMAGTNKSGSEAWVDNTGAKR